MNKTLLIVAFLSLTTLAFADEDSELVEYKHILNAEEITTKSSVTYTTSHIVADGYFAILADTVYSEENGYEVKDIEINNSNSGEFTLRDGNTYSSSKRIQLKGAGNNEYRAIMFTALERGELDIIAKGNATGQSDRYLMLINVAYSEEEQDYVPQMVTMSRNYFEGSEVQTTTLTFEEAGTYYLVSSNKAINIYLVASTAELDWLGDVTIDDEAEEERPYDGNLIYSGNPYVSFDYDFTNMASSLSSMFDSGSEEVQDKTIYFNQTDQSASTEYTGDGILSYVTARYDNSASSYTSTTDDGTSRNVISTGGKTQSKNSIFGAYFQIDIPGKYFNKYLSITADFCSASAAERTAYVTKEVESTNNITPSNILGSATSTSKTDKQTLKNVVIIDVPTDGITLYITVDASVMFYDVSIALYDEKPEVEKEEVESEAISSIRANDSTELSRYNVFGQKIDGPQKGINIVEYSDGTIQKVLVK